MSERYVREYARSLQDPEGFWSDDPVALEEIGADLHSIGDPHAP